VKASVEHGSLYAVSFFDKRKVHMLASFPAPVGKVRRKVKAKNGKPFHWLEIDLPCHVAVYNSAMGGTDLTKQVVSQGLPHLLTRRPTTRLFEHILMYAVNNTRILYWRHQQQQAPK
jgi:hypothetical protein